MTGIETARGAAKYTQFDSTNALGTGRFGAADAIFKDYYLPGVRELLNSKRILSRYIRRNTEDVAGKEAVISLNTGRNYGYGSVGEDGHLPEPGRQKYDRATYRMCYDYGRIKVTGPSSSSSRNDRGAFIRVLDSEIRGMARDLQHDFNRQLFGDGSGRLCNVVTGAAGPTYTAEFPGGFSDNLGIGTQYLRDGMRVAFVDSATNFANPTILAHAGGNLAFFIVNLDHSAGTFQISLTEGGAAVSLASNTTVETALVLAAKVNSDLTVNDTAWMNEVNGLAAIVDDGNPYGGTGSSPGINPNASRDLGGIDADSEAIWRAYVNNHSGTPVPWDQDDILQMMDGVDQIGDGTLQLLMTSHGIRRQYFNDLVGNRRYAGNAMELDGGYRALEFSDIPMVVDKDCTRGRVYGLDFETIQMFMETDWYWMDADGSILQRMLNQDAYQATLYRYHQCGTDARNRNAVTSNIIDY